MGLFGGIARGMERKSDGSGTRFGSIDEMWKDLFGAPSRSGVSVTWQKALAQTTCLACIRRIAEGVATVPVKLYQRQPGASVRRREAREHPLYDLVATIPNDFQDSLEFRETLAFHTALTGNGYAYISRSGNRVLELLPLETQRMQVRTEPHDTLRYRYVWPDGSVEEFDQGEIWHIRGPSWNGKVALDALKLAREAIGLAIATEDTHALLHANGVRPSGVLSFKQRLSDPARDKIRKAWELVKQGGTAIVDGDASFTPMALTGIDSQHVELRRLQAEEICRALGVLPIMVGIAEKTASYASSEQMFLAHLVHTVRPWHRRFEQSMDRALLTPAERRDGYYFGFVDQEFLRASAKDRAEYNKVAIGGGSNPGWLSINDIRGHDELDAAPGGDRIYAPLNAGPIGDDGVPIAAQRAAALPATPEPERTEE